jgi:hypothetical protein
VSAWASLIPALVGLPLAGFLVTAAIGRRLDKSAHWIPVLAILTVWFIASLIAFDVLTGSAPLLDGSAETHGYAVQLFTWIPADRFVVEVGFVIDPLTACLLIVVTTIGSPGSSSASRATCSSASGTASAQRPWRRRRRLSSTASATSASRSGSWRSG